MYTRGQVIGEIPNCVFCASCGGDSNPLTATQKLVAYTKRRLLYEREFVRHPLQILGQPGQFLFRMPKIRFSRLRLPDLCP